MAGPESEHIYGIQLRESANDGSDFSNGDTDYRVVFLGEDGALHAKDSAGTVTDLGGSIASLDDIGDVNAPTPSNGDVLTWDSTPGEWVASAAAGGGAPTTAKYVTSASDGTLSAEIVIPGMAGSADIASGGGADDEFDQNTSGTPSGWTAFNSPDTVNTNAVRSHLYIKANAASGDNIKAIYKACPTIPFTVTCKMSDYFIKANYTGAGLILLDSTPTKLLTLGAATNVNERFGGTNWTNKTTVSGGAGTDYVCTPWPNAYLRFVVNSSSNVDLYVSRGGRVWRSLGTAFNPGFTVANVGLYVNSNNASDAGEAYFDWIRFT